MADTKTHFDCHHCGPVEWRKVVSLYDRDRDCVVGYSCGRCDHEQPRKMAETLAVADPAAFKEPSK